MLSKAEQIDILKKLYEVSEYCQSQTVDNNSHCYLLDDEKDIDDCPYSLICRATQLISPCLPEDFNAFDTYIEEE